MAREAADRVRGVVLSEDWPIEVWALSGTQRCDDRGLFEIPCAGPWYIQPGVCLGRVPKYVCGHHRLVGYLVRARRALRQTSDAVSQGGRRGATH